ncbi:hypothetical protein Rhopal_000372-T1 [Rhodotorula paludigena]|uniref:Proteophosphoglycan ppg4 n=1 Tax=Rhodotorula paludigena TaxID=86838 RepID=A0AAV5GAS8_9BASI|nr:hypothetical protein Rhopal_000372-T1 [Rhodotorula paludigena]
MDKRPSSHFRVDKRANDGFWTPGMGEAGFDEAAATAVDSPAPTPVYNPKAQAPTDSPAMVTLTLTAVIKVISPTNAGDSGVDAPAPSLASSADGAQTELIFGPSTAPVKVVQPAPSTLATSEPSPQPVDRPSTAGANMFGGASSSGLVRFLGAATSATPVYIAAASTSTSPSPIVLPSSSSVGSDRIFTLPTESTIRAVVTSTTPATQQTSSMAISAAAPAASMSNSVDGSVGETPADSMSTPSSGSSPSTSAEDAANRSLTSSSARTATPSSTARAGLSTSNQPSSTAPRSPDATGRSSSPFDRIGDSPANIALTTIIALIIFAILVAVLAFCLRRCHRRRKRARVGQTLGSDSGSPELERGARWSPVTPAAAWTPLTTDAAGEGGQVGDGVREMRELWRQSLGDLAPQAGLVVPGSSRIAASERPPSSDWTSFVGGHPSTEGGHEGRRDSAATVNTGILDWGERRHGSIGGLAPPPRRPHPLRTVFRPSYSSPSAYSESTGNALSPNSIVHSPRQPGLGSPFRFGAVPALTRTSASTTSPLSPTGPSHPGLRSKPSWKDSLDRVMGSAADIIGATFLSRDSSPASSRRGSYVRSVGALRRAFGVTGSDEEKGEKRDRQTRDDDDEKADYFTEYAGPRVPLSGQFASRPTFEPERPVSPMSPPLAGGYAPALGALGLVAPIRPAHYRASSSVSYYPTTTQPPVFATPHQSTPSVAPSANRSSCSSASTSSTSRAIAGLADVATAVLVAQHGSTARARRDALSPVLDSAVPPSPVIPPVTPEPLVRPALAGLQNSPAPFSRLERVEGSSSPPSPELAQRDASSAISHDPFADPASSRPPLAQVRRRSASLGSLASAASDSTSTSSSSEADASPSRRHQQLARHSAFAQLYLQRRMEGRRASTPNFVRSRFSTGDRRSSLALSVGGAFEATPRPASVACDNLGRSLGSAILGQPDALSDDDAEVSSLELSSSEDGGVARSDVRTLETDDERHARRARTSLERERAAVLMYERRRRSLGGESLFGTGRRGSLAGSVAASVA